MWYTFRFLNNIGYVFMEVDSTNIPKSTAESLIGIGRSSWLYCPNTVKKDQSTTRLLKRTTAYSAKFIVILKNLYFTDQSKQRYAALLTPSFGQWIAWNWFSWFGARLGVVRKLTSSPLGHSYPRVKKLKLTQVYMYSSNNSKGITSSDVYVKFPIKLEK